MHRNLQEEEELKYEERELEILEDDGNPLHPTEEGEEDA